MGSFGPSATMASDGTTRTVFGIIGNLTALVLYASAVPTFVDIWKKRAVQQYSPMPYLAALLNCIIWVIYGLPFVQPHSTLVITVNGIGVAIEFTYVALFFNFSAGVVRRKVGLLFAAEVAFVAIVAALVLSLAHTPERRSMVFGILGIISGTGMYAAPLSDMKSVVETGSVEYMSLPLSVASFVNAIFWTIYALIRFDLYVFIPNLLGVLCAAALLGLYACYSNNAEARN